MTPPEVSADAGRVSTAERVGAFRSTPDVQLGLSSAAFLGSNLARAAIGFGLTLAIGRGLGAHRFGQWVLCTTWASLLTVVADLGFGVLLTRDGARPGAPVARLVGGALLLRLAVVVPLGAILYACAGRLSADAESIAGLRVAALLGIAGAAYGCFGAMLQSQARWLPTVLGLETVWLAVQLAGSWWLVQVGAGGAGAAGAARRELVALMTLALCVQVAQIATAMVLWRTVFGIRRRTHEEGEPLMMLMRRALPFAASGIVANLQSRVAPLMLGGLSTSSEVGLFAAASRVGRLARLAPQAVFGGALPVLSHEFGRDRAEAQRLFSRLDRALLGFGASVAGACLLAAPALLRIIYGSSFIAAAPALMWVGIGLIPALSNSGRQIALYAAGGEALVVRWTAVALIVQVASALVLIPLMGSTGAAVSIAVAEAAVWLPLRRARKTRIDRDLHLALPTSA
jgi:O-antigen/teichoic acid export membrane protein